MNPKDGTAGTPVDPAEPELAEDADSADPGEVEEAKAEQREAGEGKYGKASPPPVREPEDEEEETTWVKIRLVDREDNPVPSEFYRVEDAEGNVHQGTLDEDGFAEVRWLKPGDCKISFPRLDKDAWEDKEG